MIQFMILIPPISRTSVGADEPDTPISSTELTGHRLEYGFIVEHYTHINYHLLTAQLAVVAVISGVLTYLWRDKIP